jgi:membrane protease YdiL (CAAX protease family)
VKEQRKSWTNIILAILPPLSTVVMTVVAYFAAFMGSYMLLGNYEDLETDNLGVHAPLFLLIRNILMLIAFSYWYYIFFLRKKEPDIIDNIKAGFRSVKKPVFYIIIVIGGYILQFIVTHIIRLLTSLLPDFMSGYNSEVGSLIKGDVSVLTLLSVALIAPIAEELLFRGLTQKYAERAIGALPAIFFQAALFGIYHMNIVQGIYAFIFGIIFGFIARKTKSVFPGIVLHIIFNISAYLIP